MRGHGNDNAARLWRMDSDGSNLKQLTSGQNDGLPNCTPTGKWVYYSGGRESPWMRIPVEGGSAETLQPRGSAIWSVFPISGVAPDDRRFVAFGTEADASNNTYHKKLGIFSAASVDAPVQVVDPNPLINVSNGLTLHFTPDGQALAYSVTGDNNADNIWLQPLDGKPGSQITQFRSDNIFGFGWSPDGKKLLIPRGHVESDILLLRDTTK